MAPPITHHTSHTMGNGASSSNCGSQGGGSSAVTHHTSHTMANGASSGAGGSAQGGEGVSSSSHDGHLGGHATEFTMTDPPTDLQDLNTIGTGPDSSVDDYDFDDRPGSTGALSLSSSVSNIASSDMDESIAPTIASGITSMSSSVNLASWKIVDTTLREGEQFINAFFDRETKMKIAQALDDFGVEYIELTSPAASAQSKEDCAAICKMGLKAKVLCHIRCNMDDARLAIETGVDGINMFIGTSKILMAHSHGKDMDFIAATAKEVIEYVKANNVEIRFSGEDSFRTDFDEILKLYSLMDSLGVNRVGIADTVGGASPMEVYDKISMLRKTVSCDIETHFHNDTGCAIANGMLAVEAGATHIDTTVLGIGERNGITPLGGLLAALMPNHRQTILDRYNIEKLGALEQLVAECASVEIPFKRFVLA